MVTANEEFLVTRGTNKLPRDLDRYNFYRLEAYMIGLGSGMNWGKYLGCYGSYNPYTLTFIDTTSVTYQHTLPEEKRDIYAYLFWVFEWGIFITRISELRPTRIRSVLDEGTIEIALGNFYTILTAYLRCRDWNLPKFQDSDLNLMNSSTRIFIADPATGGKDNISILGIKSSPIVDLLQERFIYRILGRQG